MSLVPSDLNSQAPVASPEGIRAPAQAFGTHLPDGSAMTPHKNIMQLSTNTKLVKSIPLSQTI